MVVGTVYRCPKCGGAAKGCVTDRPCFNCRNPKLAGVTRSIDLITGEHEVERCPCFKCSELRRIVREANEPDV